MDLTYGETPGFDGPEPLDPEAMTVYEQSVDPYFLAVSPPLCRGLVDARPVALGVNGEMVWTEQDKDSPAAALTAYFARLVPFPAKPPSPNAKPALAGLMRTGGSRRGPGWCDE